MSFAILSSHSQDPQRQIPSLSFPCLAWALTRQDPAKSLIPHPSLMSASPMSLHALSSLPQTCFLQPPEA